MSALARLTAAIGSSQAPEPGSGPLCVRHVLRVRRLDRPAAHVLVTGSLMVADQLSRELAEALDRTAWSARQGTPAPASSAWQRAAAFLDGGVYGGCLPRAPVRRQA